jgi:uncharacterized YccA/Bax inhibitor family protein
MFKYKMTLPRTLLFLLISLSLSIYVINNIHEINNLKIIFSILIIGIMSYMSLNYITQLINKKSK